MTRKTNEITSNPRAKQRREETTGASVPHGTSQQKSVSKASKRYSLLPPSGPSNIIVRTASPLPAPQNVESQK